jgi:hypothetical protein
MTLTLRPTHNGPGPRRRHHSRVQRFSSNPALLDRLDALIISDTAARTLIEASCQGLDVPQPDLKFHARRSEFTGATERPRFVWVNELGEREVRRRESNGWGALPVRGVVRLGRSTTLMTVAHELGHHVVYFRDPPKTPAHGKVWIARFDEAALTVNSFVTD